MYQCDHRLMDSAVKFSQLVVFCFLFGNIRGQECDFNITSSVGEFTSPMYPDPYPAGLNCTWRFTALPGRVIEVTFEDVDLEEKDSLGNCPDNVTVYDGSSPILPFCSDGPGWPRFPQRHLSMSNTMTVTMQSNNNNSDDSGFRARYKHVLPRNEHIVAIGVDPPTIVRIDRFRIQGIPPIPLTETLRPSALGFDPIDEYFYYTDIQQRRIARIREDETDHEVIVDQGIVNPLGIVVGYLTGLLYWTDVGRDEISVSRLDGMFRKTLIPANTGCVSPRGIELSFDQQYVIWTCSDLIEKSKADGTERTTIVSGIFDVKSIAIDHENEQLYWTDVNTGNIEVVDLDGNNRVSIGGHAVFQFSHGFVVEAGTLFWTEPAERRILLVDLESPSIRTVTQGEGNSMEGLYYYRSDRVISEEHVCSKKTCSQLCFPDGLVFSCEEVTPTIVNCPEDINRATTGVKTISWAEPTAVSRSNGVAPVNLPFDSRSHAPGSGFFWGNTTVRYHFTDDLGNEAECTFNVVLTQFVATTTKRQTTTERQTTTRRFSSTKSPTTTSQTSVLLTYTIVGISVIVLVVIIGFTVCITCCCGCWQCTCRPKGRDPVVSQYGMTSMQGTTNVGYTQQVQPPYGGAVDSGYYAQGVYDPGQKSSYYMQPI